MVFGPDNRENVEESSIKNALNPKNYGFSFMLNGNLP